MVLWRPFQTGSAPVHLSPFLFVTRNSFLITKSRLPLINLAFIYTMKFQISGSFFLLLSLQNKTKPPNKQRETERWVRVNTKQYKHISGHKSTSDSTINLFVVVKICFQLNNAWERAIIAKKCSSSKYISQKTGCYYFFILTSVGQH